MAREHEQVGGRLWVRYLEWRSLCDAWVLRGERGGVNPRFVAYLVAVRVLQGLGWLAVLTAFIGMLSALQWVGFDPITLLLLSGSITFIVVGLWLKK